MEQKLVKEDTARFLDLAPYSTPI
jgi:hypothetical protein